MATVAPDLLTALAAILKERVGLHVRPDGHGALRLALNARLGEGAAADPESYLARLASPDGEDELRRLLPLVTVGKTSFFRDDRQFAALAALVPELLSTCRRAGRKLSVWSAGCATGEEPLSIAMTLLEAGARPGEVELLATDLNPEAVAACRAGRYHARRARELPEALRARFFDTEGGELVARPELRAMLADVRTHNLASPLYPRPAAGAWDLLFCRNVIIYFDTHTARQVLSRFHAVLAPNGHLFLGYSESLFRLFDGFELTEIAGAFLYRKPESARRATVAPPAAGPIPHRYAVTPVRHATPPPPAPPPATAASAAPPPKAPAPVAFPGPSPQEVLDLAVGLIEEGKFVAALDRLERLVAEGGESLAVRLTLANLYNVLRQPQQAVEAYRAALALEPLHAEAHLFFGIHLLSEGQADAAAEELARALFLDPDLALAHYYLGRCRERQRDLGRARLSYRNAIDAYRREPLGRRQSFLGYYPDLPEDGSAFARAAEYALAAL